METIYSLAGSPLVCVIGSENRNALVGGQGSTTSLIQGVLVRNRAGRSFGIALILVQTAQETHIPRYLRIP